MRSLAKPLVTDNGLDPVRDCGCGCLSPSLAHENQLSCSSHVPAPAELQLETGLGDVGAGTFLERKKNSRNGA
jgi:hypothetical protein